MFQLLENQSSNWKLIPSTAATSHGLEPCTNEGGCYAASSRCLLAILLKLLAVLFEVDFLNRSDYFTSIFRRMYISSDNPRLWVILQNLDTVRRQPCCDENFTYLEKIFHSSGETF